MKRADFNADNVKIDAALKAVADAASGGARIAAGSYALTSSLGANERYYVNVGFRPKAVFIRCIMHLSNNYELCYSALFVDGTEYKMSGETYARAGMTDTGFYVRAGEYPNYTYPALAMTGYTYCYVAFG